MSLSNTSHEFLRELTNALARTEVDGDLAWYRNTRRLVFIGNGGSMAISTHLANDVIKTGYPAFAPDVVSLSCLANDFGWEMALAKWLEANLYAADIVIAISSSGRSKNIINACEGPLELGRLVTLTGFDADNPLRKLGHTNYWVPSHNYGIVECAHLAILHSIVNPGALKSGVL